MVFGNNIFFRSFCLKLNNISQPPPNMEKHGESTNCTQSCIESSLNSFCLKKSFIFVIKKNSSLLKFQIVALFREKMSCRKYPFRVMITENISSKLHHVVQSAVANEFNGCLLIQAAFFETFLKEKNIGILWCEVTLMSALTISSGRG